MKKSVFVILNDVWHPGTEYTGVLGRVFPDDRWDVTVSDYPRELPALTRAPDLAVRVVGHRNDEFTPSFDEHQRVLDMVREGMNVLYWHAGLAYVREDSPERTVAGGTFVVHPPMDKPVTLSPIPGVRHPMLRGIEPVEAVDEHYFCRVDIERVTPILLSLSPHGTEIAGWTHTVGKGRVCALTQGHDRRMVEKMEPLVRNAVMWCMGELD